MATEMGAGTEPAGSAAAAVAPTGSEPASLAYPRLPDQDVAALEHAQLPGREGGAVAPRLGLGEWLGRISAAVRMQIPQLLRGRRTVSSVGAYFDLVTDDGRLFFGDSFHLGYFPMGNETLAEALNAHTDLVADLARIQPGDRVLDVGCGVGAPALRIAGRHGCHITGINASRRQVCQGRELIAKSILSAQVDIRHGNALALDFEDESFDVVLCLEAAGDICVTDDSKDELLRELRRVLRPGGCVGFSDLAFTSAPTAAEDKILRAVLYHSGSELVGDWAGRFRQAGFEVVHHRDILGATLPTWRHTEAVYIERAEEVNRRYGKLIAERTMHNLSQIGSIVARYGSFPVISARRPFD